jgi:hypothetical protein
VYSWCKVHVVRGVRYKWCKLRTRVHGSITISPDVLGYLPFSKERLTPIARLMNVANVPEMRLAMRASTRAPSSVKVIRPK